MTLLKSKNDLHNLRSFISDFFDNTDGILEPIRFNEKWFPKLPATNVQELEKEFKVEVAVPGMKKEDFKINVAGDLLTISAEKEEQKEENKENYTRREFNYNRFSRSFNLPENVLGADMTAAYENGVLRISIPKKVVSEPAKSVKEIKVS